MKLSGTIVAVMLSFGFSAGGPLLRDVSLLSAVPALADVSMDASSTSDSDGVSSGELASGDGSDGAAGSSDSSANDTCSDVGDVSASASRC